MRCVNVQLLVVQASGTYSYHVAVKFFFSIWNFLLLRKTLHKLQRASLTRLVKAVFGSCVQKSILVLVLSIVCNIPMS
jgi:hypothetical protein